MINDNESMSYSLNNISTSIRSSLLIDEILILLINSKNKYTVRQKTLYIRKLERR